jgi:DNA topoisomerase VI subunit B
MTDHTRYRLPRRGRLARRPVGWIDPMRTAHAQDRSNKSGDIPDRNGANAASATDGTFYAGSVVEHRCVHFALNFDGHSVGEFATDAVAALPADGADEAASPDGFNRLNRRSGSEIFTKFANVKSRIGWTAERQRLLRKMWDRGDKVAAIAAALECKVGAVNVARARFGLKPRRIVSGRPKLVDDEPVHKIERVAFTTSRLMEFCTEKELVAQTGHESSKWPLVVIKELVDNGIDACEEAGIAPVIKVTITIGRKRKPTRIVIEDNGPGIPAETVTGLIDYNVRISSREAYISPTRGRQGNALKTILPMAYVLGRESRRGETWIEARGLKHGIQFTVNQIKQEPIVKNIKRHSRVRTGTRITVFWPDYDEALVDPGEIGELLKQFIWVNPHLTLRFTVDGKTLIRCAATNHNWTKYQACDATSAHWYKLEQLERYAGALIARDQEQRRATRHKYTVRQFIAQFRGMSATDKQKQILRELGAAHMTLHQFFGSETQVNHQRMERLLKLLQKHTRPVRSELLGVIGADHLRQLCINVGGEPQSFKYFVSPQHDDDGRPYVIEIATCPYKKWVAGKSETRNRQLITGVNFSATLENPFDTLRNMEGMEEMLNELRAGTYAPIIVCVHYASPHIEYLDRGKSRISLE